MDASILEALERAHRLERMGLLVRSDELADEAKRLEMFYANGGNRAMRRAAARAAKKTGADRTLKVGGAKVR